MSSPQIERKLAAIMFTDIAGYTESMSKSESKTLNLLEKKRSILKPLLKEYKGTFVKEIGDGTLSYFESAVNAATCAVKLQESTYDDKDMNIRVGIHIGDIVFKDGDVFGGGVNVASRLESIAPAGGVCVSKSVYDELSNQDDFDGIELGLQSLKGVGRLIEVFGLKGEKLNEPNPDEYQDNKIDKHSDDEVPSIAIIPFDNKGADEDVFYAYGICVDLISDVTSAGLIRVASKKQIDEAGELPQKELAKKLDVRYMANGELWRMGDMFQLSIELYDTKDKKVVWSDRWQENWDNLPTIKGSLSDGLLKALDTKPKVEKKVETTNTEAYEYYLKAKYKYEKRKNMEDVEIVRGLLLKAIEIDEYLIEANELLGMTYVDVGDYEKALSIYKRVLKFAEQKENEIGIAIIKISIAWVYLNKGDDLDIALEYGNHSRNIFEKYDNLHGISDCDVLFGYYYWLSGNLALADEYQRKANQFFDKIGDYNLIALGLINTGWGYLELDEYDNAMNLFHDALKLSKKIESQSGIAVAYNCIGSVYAVTGNYDLAIEYDTNSLKLHETIGEKYWIGEMNKKLGNLYIKKGEYDLSIKYINTALNIYEEIDNKQGLSSLYFSLGTYYYNIGQYSKARDNFIKCNNSSLFKNNNLDEKIKKDKLSFRDRTTLFSQLYIYKINTLEKVNFVKGKEQLLSLIKRYNKSISFRMNFMCYELLENTSYLENAYSQVQEKADNLEPDVKLKFLSYPIPKAIVEEWEKVK